MYITNFKKNSWKNKLSVVRGIDISKILEFDVIGTKPKVNMDEYLNEGVIFL